MTYSELAHFLEDPSGLTLRHLDDLLLLSRQYPYCEPLHRLILICLHQNGDLRYSSELSRRILYISDPAQLFLTLKDHSHTPTHTIPEEEKEPQDAFSIIDNFLQDHPDDAREVEEMLDLIQAPLPEEEPKSEEPKESTGDLINAFLAKGEAAEKIPTVAEVTPPPSESSVTPAQDEELFTETLARIYIRQAKYAEALRIFKTLNLNYSEKNSYFAEQVAYLEKLIKVMSPAPVDKNK